MPLRVTVIVGRNDAHRNAQALRNLDMEIQTLQRATYFDIAVCGEQASTTARS